MAILKTVGLIVEYNPLHNGHVYHIQQAKRLTNSENVVCVMSGNFIQRGEPAIIDKWARAEMALLAGADLVIELPVVYAMASAEFFSFGAVKLLESTGVVDSLCFGSEYGEIEALEEIANILAFEPGEFKEYLKGFLSTGISFPKAREKALLSYFERYGSNDVENVGDILCKANNILGIEYLKALKRINSSIKPYTIKRLANEYNQTQLSGSISSATAIRYGVQVGKIEETFKSMPKSSIDIFKREVEEGRAPIYLSNYDRMALGILRSLTVSQLADLPFASEGLHNRIKKSLNCSSSLLELFDNVTSKRYTRTRIQRSVLHALTGLKQSEFNAFNDDGGPKYIRILGFNNKGRLLLKKMGEVSKLPVFVKAANILSTLDEEQKRMFEIEVFSTDMYVLGYPKAGMQTGQELTRNIIKA